MPRIIFDIDDTICSNIRRTGYENCKPDYEVINKINYLHDELKFEIILYTSRGMVSCKEDIQKIIEKNKTILENWLEKYGVHYDNIIFGKPIADLYVDDKALNIKDFKTESFSILNGGGSNKPIYKLGKVVKKILKNEEDISNFKDWVEDNNNLCLFPKVNSYLYNSIYMDYIEGNNLVNCFNEKDLFELIKIIYSFSEQKYNSFNLNTQLNVLKENYCQDEEINLMINKCINKLQENEKILIKNASYSHGDMILSNIIKTNNNELYFIDSRYFRNSSSYLLDFAKLRMSLCNYEYVFGLSDVDNSKYLIELDIILKHKNIYNIVIYLQLMYVLRLYRYKDNKEKVKKLAKELIDKNEKLFK